MGFFSKLFKGPEIDMEKSNANAKKMRALFNQVVENGDNYRLIFGYTEDVSRFTLEETMARLEAMPEPEAIPYQKDDVKWERFGILLSGILSTLT